MAAVQKRLHVVVGLLLVSYVMHGRRMLSHGPPAIYGCEGPLKDRRRVLSRYFSTYMYV